MPKENWMDEMPLAKLSNTDMQRLKELEKEFNKKYNSKVYVMALTHDQ
ncbi:hypothetical protein PRVXH_000768 [Proteinivorax hydrogeniformans]|uniref:Uncharacterized protein n=1 Tax=Proteinivorax hydrogeniformans TaxID=1826727 RepID=A0AAU8HVR9_9FIRM